MRCWSYSQIFEHGHKHRDRKLCRLERKETGQPQLSSVAWWRGRGRFPRPPSINFALNIAMISRCPKIVQLPNELINVQLTDNCRRITAELLNCCQKKWKFLPDFGRRTIGIYALRASKLHKPSPRTDGRTEFLIVLGCIEADFRNTRFAKFIEIRFYKIFTLFALLRSQHFNNILSRVKKIFRLLATVCNCSINFVVLLPILVHFS